MLLELVNNFWTGPNEPNWIENIQFGRHHTRLLSAHVLNILFSTYYRVKWRHEHESRNVWLVLSCVTCGGDVNMPHFYIREDFMHKKVEEILQIIELY